MANSAEPAHRGHRPGAARAAATGSSEREPTRSDPPSPRPARPRAARRPRVHELRWNNPKLHTPDRRKVWLACDDHRESLVDFLAARSSCARSPRTSCPLRPARASVARTHVERAIRPTESRVSVALLRDRDRAVGDCSAADGGHRAGGLEEELVVDAVAGALGHHRQAPLVGDLLVGRRRRAGRARRSDSSRANRQLRTWPSAVSRTRSQSPQNGRVTEAMTPTVAGPPSTRKVSAGALPRCSGSGVRVNSRLQRGEDLLGGDHRRRGTSRAGRPAASAR